MVFSRSAAVTGASTDDDPSFRLNEALRKYAVVSAAFELDAEAFVSEASLIFGMGNLERGFFGGAEWWSKSKILSDGLSELRCSVLPGSPSPETHCHSPNSQLNPPPCRPRTLEAESRQSLQRPECTTEFFLSFRLPWTKTRLNPTLSTIIRPIERCSATHNVPGYLIRLQSPFGLSTLEMLLSCGNGDSLGKEICHGASPPG